MSEPGQGPLKWSGDPEKAFPARHPREPGGLRQDILDELADHLASALEHELEGQEDGNEDAAWGRVLERFGDPDAMARKLWWDQMRETIMREWIQAGVTFVMAVAVIAGLVLIMRLVAGVGAANEAMRVAMQQVAASNEALANAMAEQRADNEALLTAISGIQGGGAEKDDALELSTIEIVVRRGTPDGPPAPEVKVKMYGSGPSGGSLEVAGELDPSGRALFERLSQGKYIFLLEDPVSGLFGERAVTLFAGKGAGEHVFVAPDITPRPIHIDLGLPPYGRDSELLIGTVIEADWSYEDHHWNSDCEVVIGRESTRMLHRPTADTWHNRTQNNGVRSLDGAIPCVLAGEIRVEEQIMLLSPSDEQEIWRTQPKVSIGQGANQFLEAHIEKFDLTEIANGQYKGTLPEMVMNTYSEDARTARNRENVPDERDRRWMQRAARLFTESVVVSANALPEVRFGEFREGALFAVSDSTFFIANQGFESSADRVGLFALPDPSILKHARGRNIELVMAVSRVQEHTEVQNKNEGSGNARSRKVFRNEADVSGNSLAAYAVRGDWQAVTWPVFSAETPVPGATLTMDSEPFWRSDSKAVELLAATTDSLVVSVPQDLLSAEEIPVTGVLVRWEHSSDETTWNIGPIALNEDETFAPRVIVTEPIANMIAESAESP